MGWGGESTILGWGRVGHRTHPIPSHPIPSQHVNYVAILARLVGGMGNHTGTTSQQKAQKIVPIILVRCPIVYFWPLCAPTVPKRIRSFAEELLKHAV